MNDKIVLLIKYVNNCIEYIPDVSNYGVCNSNHDFVYFEKNGWKSFIKASEVKFIGMKDHYFDISMDRNGCYI